MLEPGQLAFERAGVEGVAQADLQPLGADWLDDEIDGAGAHRRDHVVDAAMGGLHDHRQLDAGLAQPRQHAQPIEVRHHQIEDHAIDPAAVRQTEQLQRRIAVVERERLVAELLQHAFKQAALDRVVVDDEHAAAHGSTFL